MLFVGDCHCRTRDVSMREEKRTGLVPLSAECLRGEFLLCQWSHACFDSWVLGMHSHTRSVVSTKKAEASQTLIRTKPPLWRLRSPCSCRYIAEPWPTKTNASAVVGRWAGTPEPEKGRKYRRQLLVVRKQPWLETAVCKRPCKGRRGALHISRYGSSRLTQTSH